MNLLARAKMSSHLIFSSPSPVKRIFNTHPKATALQQRDLFSTKTTTRSPQKPELLTKPKTRKSSAPSSTTFCQRVRKQTAALNNVWPKPAEIPYQAKVSNFVNLIGCVELPVRFESASDGKHSATTVISLVNGGQVNSLMIPVVFEGDLAHVVSCHVKKNDRVFVSGQLSADPVSLVLSESLGKLHVVVENINFVEGSKSLNILDKKKIWISSPGVVSDKLGKNGADAFDGMPQRVVIDKLRKNGTEAFDEMPQRVVIDKLRKNGAQVFDEMPQRVNDDNAYKINAESAPPAEALERKSYEPKLERVDEKYGKSAVKKKDADQIMDLWRDLVKNPLQWLDFRNHKTNGLVKEKYPDFKQKVTGEALWISSAPKWILPGIRTLEFDVLDIKPKQVKNGNVDDSWKHLVENPDSWWDNRTKKTNPRAPDFKHKETGEVLWLNGCPGWVSSKLPPMRN